MLCTYATYTGVYGGTLPLFQDLINRIDIPTNIFLKCAIYINAQMSNNPNEDVITKYVLKTFFKRIPDYDKRLLELFIQHEEEEGHKATFVNRFCIIELINQLLIHEKKGISDRDSNPEEELIFFKLILIANELRTLSDENAIKNSIIKEKNNDAFYFQRMNWGLFINQIELNPLLNFFYGTLKVITLLKDLESQNDKKCYVKEFLKIKNVPNSWEFVFWFLNVYISLYADNSMGKIGFFFEVSENQSDFFDTLCINSDEYKNTPTLQKHYIGIKDKPLMKENSTYYILDWHAFQNKIYVGFLFDFYNQTGINGIYKSFGIFKSKIGKNVIEEKFFIPLLKEAFERKNNTIFYEKNNDEKGIPDFYIRQGKYIYLFELKDNLMADSIKEGYDFEKIKKKIDEIFIVSTENKKKPQPKALYQLANSINSVIHNEFQYFDDYEKKGLKSRNIVIYPIIVYTDSKYNISGLNDYLNKQFNEILILKNLHNPIQIKKLTLIDLNFFFLNVQKFKTGKLSLQKLIIEYHKTIVTAEKSHIRQPSIQKFLNLYKSFDIIYQKYLPNKPEIETLKFFIDTLELKNIDFAINRENNKM